MGGDKCITLNRKVTSVTYDVAYSPWSPTTTTDDATRDTDSVVCCNGHPRCPKFCVWTSRAG